MQTKTTGQEPHKISFTDPSSITLFIPLWMRAEESKKKNRLFYDEDAVRLSQNLPNHCFNFLKNKATQIGTAIRVHHFDSVVKQTIARLENPVIVNLGCGLDSRFGRTDNGHGIHVNIDLPEVMALREKHLPSKNKREVNWSASLFEHTWMDRLLHNWPSGDYCFLLEGVLMFLPEEKVKNLFVQLSERFKGVEITFDSVTPSMGRMMNKRSAMQNLQAPLHWMPETPFTPESFHPALRHQKTAYYFDLFPKKWGFYNLLRLIPTFARGSFISTYQIL